jgi:hypothetical protein
MAETRNNPKKTDQKSPPKKEHPQTYKIGQYVHLVPVKVISDMFEVHPNTSRTFLKALAVPTIEINRTSYFNSYALRDALFLILQPGAPGIIMPGSPWKQRPEYKEKVRELTPALLEYLHELAGSFETEVLSRCLSETNLQKAMEETVRRRQTKTKSRLPSLFKSANPKNKTT